ncbi:hypothetical protein ACHQM5_030299 [Ranunculus cassubicifolius]
MRLPGSFKEKFLKKWKVGLQFYGSASNEMTILERKEAIKLSADVAMASARDTKPYWSRALIAKASKQETTIFRKNLVRKILGDDEYEKITKFSPLMATETNRVIRSRKILRKSCDMRRIKKHAQNKRSVAARSIAKRMVKKRTQVLKGLVPGGENMEGFALLEQTIDYLLSLQAQVHVMHKLVNATSQPRALSQK